MAEIEQVIAEKIADELEASQAPAAQPGTTALHGGGPGTTQSQHYSPGSSTSGGGVVGQHEGAGTRPLGGDYVSPTGGADAADDAQERAEAFTALCAQVKIDNAIADESLRRFRCDPVPTIGHVPGLEHLERKVKS